MNTYWRNTTFQNKRRNERKIKEIKGQKNEQQFSIPHSHERIVVGDRSTHAIYNQL